MQIKQSKRSSTVRRLIVANVLALFLLLFLAVVGLFATGLLGSVLAFIF